MNYVDIKPLDTSNGFGINTSVYFSGCNFRCPYCHNKDFWDFDCGSIWTPEVEDRVIECVSSPHVKHLCILGGEPLQQDLDTLLTFIRKVKKCTGKSVIMWTGYEWETLLKDTSRMDIVKECEIIIDGKFIQDEKDLTLAHKGSRNQREIRVLESIEGNSIVLVE